jgi:hypothetical protein
VILQIKSIIGRNPIKEKNNMSNAWETTAEDVMNVVNCMEREIQKADAEKILNLLNHGAIEKAVLYGNDLGSQVEYAYQEIKEQIIEGDLI